MIVVAGEALVDLIPAESGELTINPGGGPFNTARWLGWLGADVAFLGPIAADPLGQRLRGDLVAAGVALELVAATELPTTLALAQLDATGSATYSFYTDGTSVPDLTPERVRLPSSAEFLYVGGLGLMLEPIGSALERSVAVAREMGAEVMVDPNIRPSLIADRTRYLARLHRILELTDVLKMSVEDAAWMSFECGHGPRVVVLTEGADGATVLTADSETRVAAVPVEVVDTIGAGDAFSAGFLLRWLEDGDDVLAATRFAAQIASVACAQRGATPPAARL